MKKLLPLLFLLFSSFCNAQNYQCLQSGVKHYFTNGNGYLRGIRIDSVRTSGSDVVYYPFHTLRGSWGTGLGPYFNHITDTNGGSWLGKKVIQKIDGTFLFDNLWGDTVVIKTQASVGDSWIFCRDTTALYYNATLVGIDTMTILGVNDSVKKILVTAHNATGIVTTDPLDSFKIILTKNSGFAQIFDLYTFPYHKPDTTWAPQIDFCLDAALTSSYSSGIAPPNFTNSIFNIVNFINPNYDQLYESNVGDVFERTHYYCSCAAAMVPNYYYLDTIVTKTVLSHSPVYTISGLMGTQIPFSSSYSVIRNTYSYTTNDSTYLFDSSKMPEEVTSNLYSSNLYGYYFPNDSGHCNQSASYETGLYDYWLGNDYRYKIGLGNGPTYYYQYTGNPSQWLDQLIYSDLGGQPCGTLFAMVLDVPSINEIDGLSIYPNPTINTLTITSPYKITTITITNLIGQTVYTHEYNEEKVQVNVASLPPGVYFVRINGKDGATVTKRFVKE